MNLRRLISAAFVVVLLLAVIGLWSTFDRKAGAGRFALFLVSYVGFLYLKHGGPGARRHGLRGMALLGVFVASSIVLEMLAGWQLFGAWFGPWLETAFPAGLVVLSLPFMISEWLVAIRHKGKRSSQLWSAAILLAAVGLVASGSLASILIVALGVAVAISRVAAEIPIRKWGWGSGFSIAAASLGVSAIGASALFLGRRLVEAILGPYTLSDHMELTTQAARLIWDFPVTGGGLGSIAGLYAHYIRGLPVFYVPHSQNLFINIGIELGLIGLIAFLVVFGASVFMLLRSWKVSSETRGWAKYIAASSLASLALMLVQGFVDDPVYSSWALPALFVLPGMAVSFSSDVSQGNLVRPERRIFRPVVAAPAVMTVALLAFSWRSLGGLMFSNLGSLSMARIELFGWPSGRWSDGSLADDLSTAEGLFERAATLRPSSRTAHHRLGLIAIERQDFELAVEHLTVAHKLDPGHRGIRKALGYCLVWTGDFRRANVILDGMNEVSQELRAYENWWSDLGRKDLSERSAEMQVYLRAG